MLRAEGIGFGTVQRKDVKKASTKAVQQCRVLLCLQHNSNTKNTKD